MSDTWKSAVRPPDTMIYVGDKTNPELVIWASEIGCFGRRHEGGIFVVSKTGTRYSFPDLNMSDFMKAYIEYVKAVGVVWP